ncbi:DUF937 domain-containing protein [Lacihabitans sp. LS3-19]|uniref:DUF937 domain-containing protein n=1 Tax=Lacihabitans sp. LS3-19 TaxID=2487335 RepID=UPI0020CEFE9D|nr:DUF937 domain-containing protein [Lacihabitans sp. LS3-19]MCP9770840.1 DUF937 domain-containing protein [Lacihabitans sp. LS3-19]
MLEVLQGLIQQAGQSAVVQNNEVPNEHNEGVMGEVMQGLLGGLTNHANSQGGVGSLLGLLGGGNSQAGGSSLLSNPIVASIAQNVMGNIMSKFGLSSSAASGVVGNMLPQVLGGLINKTNDPNDSSIDMGSIMGVLSGGKTQGIDFSNILSQGMGAMADGKLDMNDLINIATGSSNQNQSSGGGGIMGSILGGLFGKK